MKETIYEGKAKIVKIQENPEEVAIFFKDDATAFDGLKKATIPEKGYYNARITSLVFQYLADQGVPTHFIKDLDARTVLAKKLQIIPVEVVVRNIATGSLVKRIGLTEGKGLIPPVVEFYYKNDPLHDPLINEDHARVLQLATPEELSELRRRALEINDLLVSLFDKANLILVDFKLEFGRYGGQILLGDEISPDTCRLWDKATRQKLDKDRFRQDLGGVPEAYREVYARLCKALDEETKGVRQKGQWTAKIYITLKKGVLDPQGVTVRDALRNLGYQSVKETRVGKLIEIQLNSVSREEAEQQIRKMCQELLANPVIEQYEFTLS